MISTAGQRSCLAMTADFDVFVDLSGSTLEGREIAANLESFRRRSGLVVEGRRITIALPLKEMEPHPGFITPSSSACEAFATALRTAGADKRGVLVIGGAWIPSNEAVWALAEYQDADPMIATVQPRFAAEQNDWIVGLPGEQSSGEIMLQRTSLPHLPELLITPELPASLFLITPQAVLAADPVGPGDFDVALWSLLISLRRRGFRNLVCNRVVVAFRLEKELVYPPPPIATGSDERSWHQDAATGRAWLAAMPERGLETVVAGGICADGRVRVLLDCRGMQDFFNGTTQAILGYLQGIVELDTSGLEITVLTTAAAAQFHQLEARYRRFRIIFDRPEGCFLVAIRLDQPWHFRTIMELHEHALFIAFNVLDTIAWDIISTDPKGLDQTWRLLARVADALLFISNYSRDRFSFRFKPHQSIPLIVTHLSLDRDEWLRAPVGAAPFQEPYILIFGNSYDHKGLDPALATLADAFPYTRIVVIGKDTSAYTGVTCLRSGSISEAEINALMANATVVVFPSYYEGFGLPVVHGLAHGRLVVVRNSVLWQEIATYSDLPGALVLFNNEFDMVEAVGRALHGLCPEGVVLGGAAAAMHSPPTWRDCARHLTELVGRLTVAHGTSRWIERQAIFGGHQ